MADFDNSGSLGRNRDKQVETHSDFKGKCKIAGVDYWIDGYKRTDDKGEAWVSLRFKPRAPGAGQRPSPAVAKPAPNEFDAELF